jgi:hypothetical protein
MRHGLLMTAVATVSVPAARHGKRIAARSRVAGAGAVVSAAFDGTLSGPFPVAPASARAPLRDNLAALQRAAGAPVTVLSRVTVGEQAMGTRLLAMAADADLTTSYQGTELISQSGVGGRVEMVSQVWHTGGGPTLVQTSDGASSPAASSAAMSSSPWGVRSPSRVALLSKHYVAPVPRTRPATMHAATVVELAGGWRAYWLGGKSAQRAVRPSRYDQRGFVCRCSSARSCAFPDAARRQSQSAAQ